MAGLSPGIDLLGRTLERDIYTCIWHKGEIGRPLGGTSFFTIFFMAHRPGWRQPWCTVTVYHIDTWSLTSHSNRAVQAWSQLIFCSFSTNLYLCKTSSSNHPLVAQNFCTSLCYWVVQHIWKWTSRLWYKLVKYLNASNYKSYKPKWPSNQEMICGWNTGIIRSVEALYCDLIQLMCWPNWYNLTTA